MIEFIERVPSPQRHASLTFSQVQPRTFSAFPRAVYHRCSSSCLSLILNAMFIDDNCFLSSHFPVSPQGPFCSFTRLSLSSSLFLLSLFFVCSMMFRMHFSSCRQTNRTHAHRHTDTHLKKALIEDVCWRARGKEWVRARTGNISIVFSLDFSLIVLEMMQNRRVDQRYTLLMCTASCSSCTSSSSFFSSSFDGLMAKRERESSKRVNKSDERSMR